MPGYMYGKKKKPMKKGKKKQRAYSGSRKK